MSNQAALELSGLRLAYGDLVAVWDVSMELHTGKITALLGRNGAGKSTLLSGAAGLLAPARGAVFLHGQDISSASAWDRTRKGLCLVPEGKRVFRGLTVRENLTLSLRAAGVKRTVVHAELERITERFPVLRDRMRVAAGSLSGGQQQMLAIASGMAARPSVLLIDEPCSGLAPVFADDVFDILLKLRDDGIAILLVEQLVEAVLDGIADDVVVIEQGRVTIADSAKNLSAKHLVDSVYSES